MELKDAILKRRSIRKYTDDKISTDILLEIGSLALNAPSASNMKVWQLVVINERYMIEKIKRFSPGMGFIPPALIVIGMDKQKALQKAGPLANKEFIYFDASIVANNISLLSLEYNLGSCIVASYNRIAVGKFLEFPDEICPLLMVAIGYPSDVSEKPKSKKESNTIFLQSYEGR